MNEERRKRALQREIEFYEGLGLRVVVIPLMTPERPLTVSCPMCGLVMMNSGTKYFCPDCGIHD